MKVSRLRLSIGTAIALGLMKGQLPAPPTTAYIMVGSRCINNCAFCTQAREAVGGSDMLSRVIWPEFSTEVVRKALAGSKSVGMSRICFQCLNDPSVLPELPELVTVFKSRSGLDVSVSISAVGADMLEELKEAGTRRVGIALDGASPEVFEKIKGSRAGNPYTWEGNWGALMSAVGIFGRMMATTHIIVGLGETDRDIVEVLSRCSKIGVLVSLFAYTPMKGTGYSGMAPELDRYRALQVARALVMEHGLSDGFSYDAEGKLIGFPPGLEDHGLDLREIFRTRGCPGCNRPYYNERPRGPMYNFPRRLEKEEASRSWSEALGYLERNWKTL